jgi:hypothetical protein
MGSCRSTARRCERAMRSLSDRRRCQNDHRTSRGQTSRNPSAPSCSSRVWRRRIVANTAGATRNTLQPPQIGKAESLSRERAPGSKVVASYRLTSHRQYRVRRPGGDVSVGHGGVGGVISVDLCSREMRFHPRRTGGRGRIIIHYRIRRPRWYRGIVSIGSGDHAERGYHSQRCDQEYLSHVFSSSIVAHPLYG